MLTRFLHIPMLPGAPNRAFPFLRTESALRAAPVFRMAYFTIKPHCGLISKTLMLQARFARPPSAHRNAPSEHSGVPHGFFGSDSAPRCLLRNAHASGSLRSPSGGRGKLRSPLHPSLLPPEMRRQTGDNPPLREKLSFGARHGFPFRSAYPQGGLVLPAHAAPTGGKTCSIHSRRNTLAAPGLFLLSYRSFFFSYFS